MLSYVGIATLGPLSIPTFQVRIMLPKLQDAAHACHQSYSAISDCCLPSRVSGIRVCPSGASANVSSTIPMRFRPRRIVRTSVFDFSVREATTFIPDAIVAKTET